MKIFNNNVEKVNSEALNREKKNIQNKNTNKFKYGQEDKVEISSEALDIKAMESKVNLGSDINSEKVNKIKNQLGNGSYKISGEKIADKIIEEETFDAYV